VELLATAGVHAPIGLPRTVDLALFSDGPTEPWSFVTYQSAVSYYAYFIVSDGDGTTETDAAAR